MMEGMGNVQFYSTSFGIFRYLYLIYQKHDERNPTEALLTDMPFVVNVVLWGLLVLWILYG